MPRNTLNDQLPHVHPTASDFKKMLDLTNQHAEKCVQESVEYNKTRWDKTHREPELIKIGDRVLLSTVNFNNLGGNKKLQPAFVGPFAMKALHGRNAVEVILSEQLSRKHPVFPVSLVKPYQGRPTEENTIPDEQTPPPFPLLEPLKGDVLKVHKILKDKKSRINGRDARLYLISYKNTSADRDEGLPESNIPEVGGNECPIVLLSNIEAFGASKKKANAFKAWVNLNSLNLQIDNIPQFTTDYWNCIATLQLLGEAIEPVSLGHAILAKLPAGLFHVRDTLIAAGSSSDLEVSYKTVLDLLDSQLSASTPTTKKIATTRVPRPSEPGEASALLTQKCPQGRHLPSATHTANNCFSIHPDRLIDFRKAMKAKQEAEAHLAMFVPPTMYNMEANTPEESKINDLARSLKALPIDPKEEDNDGHESEVSLI
ncbi:hypothetical protein MJO28_013203 [Puccinia striiformis f. sp. tritici]|uniref:Uncharacterized protein n=1 Tax=Puccinia striiformis f. sp. tritici TaxID=168172 RepID=A0ACC0DZ31_9BASI|nr:hypothetical protein MJO28_013203 [Puccinia striiformis f. sp. tritici]